MLSSVLTPTQITATAPVVDTTGSFSHTYAPMMCRMMVLADSANVADWISSIGQALGALFTAVAVVVALRISHRDSEQRAKSDEAKAWAQARSVLIDEPTYMSAKTGHGQDNDPGAMFSITVANFSNGVLLNLSAEISVPDTDGVDSAPQSGSGVLIRSETFLLLDSAGNRAQLKIHVEDGAHVASWSVEWEDSEGLTWAVNYDGYSRRLILFGSPSYRPDPRLRRIFNRLSKSYGPALYKPPRKTIIPK
jgi:hypothetical protein